MRRPPFLGWVPLATVPQRQRYYGGRYDPRHRVPWAYWFAVRYHVGLRSSWCRSARSRCPAGPGIGPGFGDHAGCTPDRLSSTWTMSGLPGFLASYPVAMPPFFDPGRPMAPRRWRRFRCCPHTHNNEGVVIEKSRGSLAALCHPLCTLHDARCHAPCNTRFRLTGCVFAERGSNPLARDERFQGVPPPFYAVLLSRTFPGAMRVSYGSDSRGFVH